MHTRGFIALTALLIFASGLASSMVSAATPDVKTGREFFKTNLPLLHSTDQFTQIISADSLSRSDQKFFENEIKSTAHQTLPKFSFENDEVYADGKATGLRITAYSPLQMSLSGRKFAFNKAKSFAQNDHDFMQFLQPSSKHARMPWLSEAVAKDNHDWWWDRPLGWKTAVLYTAFKYTLGGPIKLAYDMWTSHWQDHAVDQMLTSPDLVIHCDDKRASLSLTNGKQMYSFTLDRKSDTQKIALHYGAKISDGDPNNTPGEVAVDLTKAQNLALGMLKNCSDSLAIDKICHDNALQMCASQNYQSRAERLQCEQTALNNIFGRGDCDFTNMVKRRYQEAQGHHDVVPNGTGATAQ